MADLHEIPPKDVLTHSDKFAQKLSITTSKPTTFESLASGAVGGMALVLVGHPFDLAKVRLQTSNQFTGMGDAFRILLKREGIAGIYRGVTAPLLGVAPIFAISIWGYDTGRKAAEPFVSHELQAVALGGAFSALPTAILQVPGDRIKLRLQVANSQRHANPFQETLKILKEAGGWRKGLYKGFWVTLAREIPGSAIYFTNYNFFRGALNQKFTQQGTMSEDLTIAASVLIAGGLAGTLNGLITLPIDTIKSRYQAAPEGAFMSARQVAHKLISMEGHSALFRGLVPVLVRAFPANAACFGGIEIVRLLCNRNTLEIAQ